MDEAVTALIHAAAQGDAASRDRLIGLLYQDLLRLARSRLARERTYTDLNAPALVHEAYLRFADNLPPLAASRRVFYAYAARAMESVIVDHVRRRSAKKRGEGVAEVTLATGMEGEPQPVEPDHLESLHAALQRLERVDPGLHEIMQLRYFAGMTIDQIAELTETSSGTVKRRWKQATAILKETMGG